MREWIQKQASLEKQLQLHRGKSGRRPNIHVWWNSTAKINSLLYGLVWDSAKNILRIMFESNKKCVLSPEQKHLYIVAISLCDLQQQNTHEAAKIWKLLCVKSLALAALQFCCTNEQIALPFEQQSTSTIQPCSGWKTRVELKQMDAGWRR